MTTPRDRLSIWVAIPVACSIIVPVIDIGDRFWASAPDSQVTSYQVSQLTQAVRDLATKFDGMPKQAVVDALAAREDRSETAIGILQQNTAVLRADVDNLMHPRVREPR